MPCGMPQPGTHGGSRIMQRRFWYYGFGGTSELSRTKIARTRHECHFEIAFCPGVLLAIALLPCLAKVIVTGSACAFRYVGTVALWKSMDQPYAKSASWLNQRCQSNPTTANIRFAFIESGFSSHLCPHSGPARRQPLTRVAYTKIGYSLPKHPCGSHLNLRIGSPPPCLITEGHALRYE